MLDDIQREQIKEDVSQRERDSQKQLLEAEWEALLSTSSGRALVWDLLSNSAPVFRRATGLHDEALREYVGKREVGIDILDKVFGVSYRAFSIMMAEAAEREEALSSVVEREIKAAEKEE